MNSLFYNFCPAHAYEYTVELNFIQLLINKKEFHIVFVNKPRKLSVMWDEGFGDYIRVSSF